MGKEILAESRAQRRAYGAHATRIAIDSERRRARCKTLTLTLGPSPGFRRTPPSQALLAQLLVLGLLLESALAKFFQLHAETVPQGTLRTQLVQQGLGLLEKLLVQFVVAKQFLPASANLLFGKHVIPRRKTQKYKTVLPVRGVAALGGEFALLYPF
jgi:hypothetical protein